MSAAGNLPAALILNSLNFMLLKLFLVFKISAQNF